MAPLLGAGVCHIHVVRFRSTVRCTPYYVQPNRMQGTLDILHLSHRLGKYPESFLASDGALLGGPLADYVGSSGWPLIPASRKPPELHRPRYPIGPISRTPYTERLDALILRRILLVHSTQLVTVQVRESDTLRRITVFGHAHCVGDATARQDSLPEACDLRMSLWRQPGSCAAASSNRRSRVED